MLDKKSVVTVGGMAMLGLIIAGCSNSSLRYGTHSEAYDGPVAQTREARVPGGQRLGGQSWHPVDETDLGRARDDGGPVNAAIPLIRQSAGQPGRDGSRVASAEGGSVSRESIDFSGTDYHHQYSGVPGSGPNHGGVSGFGEGSATRETLEPGSWADAYLRGDRHLDTYPDGTGQRDVAGARKGEPSREVNPQAWADAYTQAHGGPRLEYADPEMAVANLRESQRGSPESPVQGHSGSGQASGHGSQGILQDVYFDFDSWAITSESAQDLEKGAVWLREHPVETLTIEGHCDERGTEEYNLVLGKRRAEATRDYLATLGVDARRLQVVSYGKTRPFCHRDSEHCYQANRRSHLVVPE